MKKKILSLALASTMGLSAGGLNVLPALAQEPVQTMADFSGGVGTEAAPYLISSAEELATLAASVNGGNSYSGTFFKLSGDINLNGSESNQWTPIGSYTDESNNNPFAGNFDGAGNTISGVYINNNESWFQGLFGYLTDATIQNLTVEGSVSGNGCTGGIIGLNKGTIKNCINQVKVTANAADSESLGGIAGRIMEGTIDNCINKAVVTANPSKGKIGGIAGSLRGGIIKNCINQAEVIGSSSREFNGIGGIVGYIDLLRSGNIDNCMNTGNVTVTGDLAGGIAGNVMGGKVLNCMSTGNITATENSDVGGIIGSLTNGETSNSYFLQTDAINNGLYGLGYDYANGRVPSNIGAEPKDLSFFTGGEACWLLQNPNGASQSTLVWGQTVGTGYPQLVIADKNTPLVIQTAVTYPEAISDAPNLVYLNKNTDLETFFSAYAPRGASFIWYLASNPGQTIQNLSGAGITFNSPTAAITAKLETVGVSGIQLDKTSLSVPYGQTATITATVDPPNSYYQQIKWSANPAEAVTFNRTTTQSEDPITITANQVVDSVVITARSIDPDHPVSGTCTVTITKAQPDYQPPTSIEGLVYTGSAQNLINAGSVSNGGELQYRLSSGDYSTQIPTATEAGTYTVYWQITATENYEAIPEEVITVNISKANTIITQAPNPLVSDYTGQPQNLIDQEGESNWGEFVYYQGNSQPSSEDEYSEDIPQATEAGTYTIWYKIPEDANWYGTEAQSIEAQIKKVPFSDVKDPKALDLTYNGFEQELISAGSANGASFEYSLTGQEESYSSQIPKGTNAKEYTVYYRIISDGNHHGEDQTLTGQLTATIQKGTPAYTTPSGLTAYVGDKLSSVALTGGFSWLNGDQLVGAAGTKTFNAVYTPDDTDNYETVTVPVTVTVNKRTPVITNPVEKALPYNGLEQALIEGGSSSSTVTMEYRLDNSDWSATYPQAVNVGSYTVYWRVEETFEYLGADGHITSEITAVAPVISPVPEGLTGYYTTLAQPLIINDPQSSVGNIEWSTDNQNWQSEIPTAVNPGEYTVWYRVPADTSEYKNWTALAAQSVKAVISAVEFKDYQQPEAIEDLSYTGSEQALITQGSSTNASFTYTLSENQPEDDAFGPEPPTGLNAGIYTVWYKITPSDPNYAPIINYIVAEIAKADPDYTLPSDLRAKTGQTLMDISLPSGFAWTYPEQSVGAAGEHAFEATFTPNDTENYNIVTVYIPVNVFQMPSTGLPSGPSNPSRPDEPALPPTQPEDTDPGYNNGTQGSGAGFTEPGSQTQTDETTGEQTTFTQDDSGVKSATTQDSNGNITNVDVAVPSEAIKDGKVSVDLGINQETGEKIQLVPGNIADLSSAPNVNIELPKNSGRVLVEIEIKPGTIVPGTVGLLKEDGKVVPIPISVVIDGSLCIPLEGSATIVVMDGNKTYPDVDKDAWYEKEGYVAFTSSRGILNGYADGSFAPNGTVSRGMFSRILYNLFGEPETNAQIPEGVPNGTYFTDAAAWAKSKGLMGTGSSFDPAQNLSREDMVLILYRIVGSPEANMSALNAYPDSKEVSGYAKAAMAWGVENKIIGQGSKLDPNSDGTRAEIAAIITRFIQSNYPELLSALDRLG